MRVDAIWCTRDESTVVLFGVDFQGVHLVWQDDEDLIDLIRERLVEDAEHERIAGLKLIEVSEQFCARQTSMSGQHAMGPHAAGGEGGTLDMADGDLQDGGVCAMVDGEAALDGRDFDIADDAVSGDVEQGVVRFSLVVVHDIAVLFGEEELVIGLGVLPKLFIDCFIHLCDLFGVGSDGSGLVERVPVVADGGVQYEPHADEKYEKQRDC